MMQAIAYAANAVRMPFAVLALSMVIFAGCNRPSPSGNEAAHDSYNKFARSDFNRRAAQRFLPLFWRDDGNHDGAIQPAELAVLWGYGDAQVGHWVDGQQHFTQQFAQAYQSMLQPDVPAAEPTEQQRRQLVVEELAQGRTTLVETHLAKDTPAEVNMVKHLLDAAKYIERLYARQKGVFGLEEKISSDDAASRMLLYRNQSPFCEAPKTENNPACSALPAKPAHVVGLYPAELQSDPKFCEALAKAPNAKQLMDHFSIVVKGDQPGAYTTQAYNEAYKGDMDAVAKELEAAAGGFADEEPALKAYLLTAAQAFRNNDWEPANRAWVAMSAQNSKWYVRVAPDEVYYEPCALKAGFALQLARINPDSIAWREKLDPLKSEMEHTLAAMAGAPYKARDVQFKLPDFIDVVLNAADQRNAHGATVGQSLPNWGPVAAAGGRTVAMTNLYTDKDSQAQSAMQMSALFCKATNAKATTSGKESLISALLHEAAHNLGPSHEYQVRGQVDDVAFGGPLASTLEELKAQTSSLFLTDWLAGKGIFTREEVDQIHLRDVAWAFGHISRGMYAADGTPRNYSQLAAIQLGSLVSAGAVAWKPDELAANGTDQGCLEIDFSKTAPAIAALEITVLTIKARNDKAGAERLKAQFVDGRNDFAGIKATITERWLRAPKATFVYSVVF